jgi:sirohydrochlorin ferrochelatase
MALNLTPAMRAGAALMVELDELKLQNAELIAAAPTGKLDLEARRTAYRAFRLRYELENWLATEALNQQPPKKKSARPRTK